MINKMEKIPSTYKLSVKLQTDGDWFIDYPMFESVKMHLNNYDFKLNNNGDFKFELITWCVEDDVELYIFINDFIFIINKIFKLKSHKTFGGEPISIFEYFGLTKENFIGTKFSNGNYDVIFKLKEITEHIN